MKPKPTVTLAFCLLALPLTSALAEIEQLKIAAKVATLNLGPKLNLTCTPKQGYGAVTVTNPLNVPIPADTKVGFHYTRLAHVQQGWVTVERALPTDVEGHLSSTLGPHQSREWQAPEIIHGFGCSAWFYGGLPDLQVVQVTRNQNVITAVIRNINPFADAGPFVMRIKTMKCSQIELATTDLNLPGLAKGMTAPISRPVPLPPGFQYLDVVLDAANAVRESNENNNTYTEVGVCIR